MAEEREVPEGRRVHGRGIDVASEARPGVPRERPPWPDPGAYWSRPEQQRGVQPLARSGIPGATAVFGTAVPARGLSGALRRLAYRIPEHRASRWIVLMAADRVDVLEHRARRGLWLVPVVLAVALGYTAVSRALRRSV